MQFAIKESKRVQATPGQRAACPSCGQEVLAKCGKIVVWHWAHINADCDVWSEPESAWHRSWKEMVRDDVTEVVMGNHRADIVGNNGVVVELQKSSLAVEDIEEREKFYRNMIWLFDASEFQDRVHFRQRDGYISFYWQAPRWSHAKCTKPLFWDMGRDRIFQVKKIHMKRASGWRNSPYGPVTSDRKWQRCGGWGLIRSRSEFVQHHLSSVLKPPHSTDPAMPR